MSQVHYGNDADEVLAALTLGPTPGVTEWEIRESSYEDHKWYPKATAVLTINGHDYHVVVTRYPDGE